MTEADSSLVHMYCMPQPSVSRIGLVRPDRARSLQELLVRMAKSGQIRGRVSDDQLVSLLDQVAQAETRNSGAASANKSKITVSVIISKPGFYGQLSLPWPQSLCGPKESFASNSF